MMRLRLLCLLSMLVGIGVAPSGVDAQSPDNAPIILLIGGDIWTVTPHDGAFTRLTTNAHIQQFVLSPDGTRLATNYLAPLTLEDIQLNGVRSGHWANDLGLLDLETGEHTPIAEQPPGATVSEHGISDSVHRSTPSWSPNSAHLVWGKMRYQSEHKLMRFDTASNTTTFFANLPEQAGVPAPVSAFWGTQGIAVSSYEYEDGDWNSTNYLSFFLLFDRL